MAHSDFTFAQSPSGLREMRMTQPLLFVFLVIFIKETISSVGPALEDINSENQEQEQPRNISEILHSQVNISSIPEVDCECMHGNCTEVHLRKFALIIINCVLYHISPSLYFWRQNILCPG